MTIEFYEAVNTRRTLKKDVDFALTRRILEADNSAPTWNHNRT